MPNVFVSTAETSAELHTSHLVKALCDMTPGLVVDAAGSEALAAAGANIEVDMAGRSVMGLWEAVKQLTFFRRAGKRILAALEKRRHDALVLVDAPSFHLPIAKIARRLRPDLPILYYIAPKLWAWKEWRVKYLRRDVTRTLCIFPFEVDFFRKRGVDAVFVGNPTLDQVRRVDPKGQTRRFGVEDALRLDTPAQGLLSVFPGSRRSEIKYIWPAMAGAIRLLAPRFPELKFAIALAPGVNADLLTSHAAVPPRVEFVRRESQELLAASSVVLAKSGTTTLEAALLGKPMAVCYALDAVGFRIGKLLVKVKYAALPNLLAGKEVAREFLQGDCTPENLAAEMGRLLTDADYYRKMRSELLQVRRMLGDEPAAERAAREVRSFLGS